MYNPKIPLSLTRKPIISSLPYVFIVYKMDRHYWDKTGILMKRVKKKKKFEGWKWNNICALRLL